MRLSLFFLSAFFFALPSFAEAANPDVAGSGIGISIEPFLSDLSLKEGESEKPFSIHLSNSSQGTSVLELSAVDFGTLDVSAGNAFLGADGNIDRTYSKAEWIDLASSEVELPPGESITVSGKIINSEGLAPGGHYGAILIRIREGESLAYGLANVAIDQRLSALVFLKKYGGERFGMEFSQISAPRTWLGTVESIEATLKNSGNVHIVPRGVVEVMDPTGRMVGKGVMNQDSSILLPGASRSFSIQIFETRKLLIPGMYTVKVGVRYDGKDMFEYRERRIFAFPPISAMMAGLLLMGGSGYVMFRGKKRKKESRAS